MFKKVELEVREGETQAQAFARVYAGDMAKESLTIVKMVKIITRVVATGAMLISYSHQAGFFMQLGMLALAAWVIPGLVDLLTLASTIVLSAKAVQPVSKKVAAVVLPFPVIFSAIMNFMGPGTTVVKIAYALTVLLIPAGEVVNANLFPSFQVMDAMERAATAIVPPAATAPVVAPATRRVSRAVQAARQAAAKASAARDPFQPPAKLARAEQISPGTAKKYLELAAAAASGQQQ